MKQKLFIGILIILLLSVISYMVWDFNNDNKVQQNPYQYKLDNLSEVNDTNILYTEIDKIIPKLDSIRSIYIDKQDKIYISGNSRLLIYNNKKELLNEFDITGTANCIATDNQENIYLVYKNRISVLNNKGKEIRDWSSDYKSFFTSVAISDSNLFVADARNKHVRKYDLNGNFFKLIGGKDSLSRPKGFIVPSPYFDLLIGRDKELWVVNPGLHTFEAYDFDGKIISTWKRTSMNVDGFSGCCNPSHIALLSNGSFVTSEKGIVRVKIHLPNGDLFCVVAEPAQFKKGTKGLDLAVDSKNRIYVLDPVKKEIRIFNKKVIE